MRMDVCPLPECLWEVTNMKERDKSCKMRSSSSSRRRRHRKIPWRELDVGSEDLSLDWFHCSALHLNEEQQHYQRSYPVKNQEYCSKSTSYCVFEIRGEAVVSAVMLPFASRGKGKFFTILRGIKSARSSTERKACSGRNLANYRKFSKIILKSFCVGFGLLWSA